MMRLDRFDYPLPEELIAQYPLPHRDASRLMVLDRETRQIQHTEFSCLPQLLQTGDLLVLNNTRVIPARLFGKKKHTGARIEIFLLSEEKPNLWNALIRPAKRVKRGTVIEFDGTFRAKLIEKNRDGTSLVELEYQGELNEILAELGHVPLPPYIKRFPDEMDRERYQNVYARRDGAVAAPTAGLHFTEALFEQLAQKAIEWTELTLHVGLGTFQPVKVELIEEHQMHGERFEFPVQAADAINGCKARGCRTVAVGTTSVRTLESVVDNGRVVPQSGATNLFIYPGYRFQVVDALITNFHLPCSTLLMLVTAFGGYEFIMEAYEEAVRQRYRFYSYGDAMLIL